MKRDWMVFAAMVILAVMMSAGALADDSYTLRRGGSRGSAVAVSMNTTYAAELTEDEEEMWYCFTTPAEPGYTTFRASRTNVSGGVYTYYYLRTGIDQVKSDLSIWMSGSRSSNLRLDPSTTYYIQVKQNNAVPGYFSVGVDFRKDDHGNTFSSASRVEIGRQYTATMDGQDDIDCFAFTPQETCDYVLEGRNDNISAYLYYGIYTGDSIDRGSGSKWYSGDFSKSCSLTAGTTYYIRFANSGWYTGNYHFTIKKQVVDLTGNFAIVMPEACEYTGKAVTPDISVKGRGTTLVKDTDYTVSFKNNVNVGAATVTVRGKGNYTGTLEAVFKIDPVPLGTLSLKKVSCTYSGKALKPDETVKAPVNGKTVTLKKDRDYQVTYHNNTNAGTAAVTVRGINNFTGELSASFRIRQVKIGSLTLKKSAMTYTGSTLMPGETVKAKVGGKTVTLKRNRDYTVTYGKCRDAGTGTVTVKGTGNYKGSLKKTFTIKPAKIVSVSLNQTTMTYTGRALRPTPTVKAKINGSMVTLKQGVDYTVVYSGNKKAGTAKVTVKGIGNYAGTLSTTFRIVRSK